jgi:hypothetical protein
MFGFLEWKSTWIQLLYLYKRTSIHCKKKVSDIPFTSRDVTYRTLPGPTRVSFKTSFDSKPKLVSTLSETKRLFRLFRVHNETESLFGTDPDQNRALEETPRS